MDRAPDYGLGGWEFESLQEYMINMKVAKDEREKYRNLVSEGAILVLCEEGTVRSLRSGFLYAAHTVIERISNDKYIVHKSRDDDFGNTVNESFLTKVDSIYKQFTSILIVIDINNIEHLKKDNFPVMSEWYHSKRGYFTGQKYGL